jgi:hypothetical protein
VRAVDVAPLELGPGLPPRVTMLTTPPIASEP